MIDEQPVADAEHRMREQFDAERRMMMDSIARISARHASARPAPGTPTGSGDVVDPENPIATPELAPLIPERAKFVACVNGKSLRSEEHTSELQSLMRISYAVFCLNKKKEKAANLERKRSITTTRSS